MLYAIISPTAKYASDQPNPFQAPEIIDAELMTAIARPYALGASSVRFEVLFGTAEKDSNGATIGFKKLGTLSLALLSSDIATWGTDDGSILKVIASKLPFLTNVTVISTVEIDGDISA